MTDEYVSQASVGSRRWTIFGGKFPKQEVIYLSQVILIYIVVIACIINLSLWDANQSLWVSLLSGCIGYILPSPKLRKKHEPVLSNTTQ
jgi:hypothetical protein